MPSPMKAGRDRLDVKLPDSAFVDAVKAGAKRNRASLTAYVVMALSRQLAIDGIVVPPPDDDAGPVRRPAKRKSK